MKDVFSVEGRVTIVTGGGTGIGAVIAREFALRGAPVLVASRNAGHLEPVRDAIRKAGGKCEMAVCDVRNAESCDAHEPRTHAPCRRARKDWERQKLSLAPHE